MKNVSGLIIKDWEYYINHCKVKYKNNEIQEISSECIDLLNKIKYVDIRYHFFLPEKISELIYLRWNVLYLSSFNEEKYKTKFENELIRDIEYLNILKSSLNLIHKNTVEKGTNHYIKIYQEVISKQEDARVINYTKRDLKQLILRKLLHPDYNSLVDELEIQIDLIKENVVLDNIGFKSSLITSKEDTTEPKKLKSEFDNMLTKEELFKMDNKLIKGLSISEVFEHFEILTVYKNKDGKTYLTEDQLLKFIEHTFVNGDPIQQEFNCDIHRAKTDIRSVFYRFYKTQNKLEKNHKGLKRKYFDILYKSFSGFDNTIDFKAFHRFNKTIDN
ncbi:hypothetical protein ACG2LH_15750 [Zhouia sp. PK063]|uniref:hypothetical protein n=1 Tax=Zhouia sp. PK063 TaxID=3373602 RepID=UPI0037929F49